MLVRTTTTLLADNGRFVPKNYRGKLTRRERQGRLEVSFGKYGLWLVRKEQIHAFV